MHTCFYIFSPVWLCAQCFVCYDNTEIEIRLLDVVQRKMMSYTLQDLQCSRCRQIKRENMAEFCACAGSFATLLSNDDIRKLLNTFRTVSENYNMILLQENVDWILKNV